MKKTQKILTFISVLLVIYSCKDDEFEATLFAAAAPSEVQTEIEVAEDNSGLVTVAPSAVGASSFQVFFGDPSNSQALVGRDKTPTNVYPEGNYTIRIVAIAPNDKTTEITQDIFVETTRILNFDSGLVRSETAREVSVTPAADNTTDFEINFGDGTTETVAPGESVRHLYPMGGDFDIVTTASSSETGKSEQFMETVSFNAGDLDLSLSFDDPLTEYEFSNFGGVSTEIVPNPNLSGTNDTASNVLAVTNSGTAFEGFAYELLSPVNFGAALKVINVDVFYDGENTIPITLQFDDGVNGERGAEVVAQHTGSGWETLEFDFANASKVFIQGDPENSQPIAATGRYTKIVFFADGPGTTQGTVLVDNIRRAIDNSVPEFEVNFEDEILEGIVEFGAPIRIVDNPFSTGINTSAKVLEINRGEGEFQGSGFSIPNLDLTTEDKIVTVKLYSTVAGMFAVDVKEGLNGARSASVSAPHSGSGWEELTFDYSNATKAFEPNDDTNFSPLPAEQVGVYTQLIFIVNGPSTDSGIFYMDDVIKK